MYSETYDRVSEDFYYICFTVFSSEVCVHNSLRNAMDFRPTLKGTSASQSIELVLLNVFRQVIVEWDYDCPKPERYSQNKTVYRNVLENREWNSIILIKD